MFCPVLCYEGAYLGQDGQVSLIDKPHGGTTSRRQVLFVKGEMDGVGKLCGRQIASTKVLRTPTGAANLHEGKRGSRSYYGGLHEGVLRRPKLPHEPEGLREGVRESQALARAHTNSKLLAKPSGDLLCFAMICCFAS